MLTLDRDRLIVLSVARFKQLTPAHLKQLHFTATTWTPLYRALERLVDRKYLARIEKRPVGGTGAGSGATVYQLGTNGWKFVGREGKYWPYRAISLHTLAIADMHMELLKKEAEGAFTLDVFETEPETWREVAGVDLRPDEFVRLIDREGRAHSLWLEIDMGTERASKIKEKLAAYWHAYRNSDREELRVFPRVVFIAPDEMRARELRYIIKSGKEEAQALFTVCTFEDFSTSVLSA